MRAAVFEREGVLTLKEVEKPAICKADDIIGRIEVCSICGTDVHMTNVPAGYESCGSISDYLCGAQHTAPGLCSQMRRGFHHRPDDAEHKG